MRRSIAKDVLELPDKMEKDPKGILPSFITLVIGDIEGQPSSSDFREALIKMFTKTDLPGEQEERWNVIKAFANGEAIRINVKGKPETAFSVERGDDFDVNFDWNAFDFHVKKPIVSPEVLDQTTQVMSDTIEQVNRELEALQSRPKNCSECKFKNLIEEQIPQSFDKVYKIFCQKQDSHEAVGEMVNGKCETRIPESCPLKTQFDLNSLPKTWEEFCKVSNISEKEYYISDYNGSVVTRVHRIRSYPVMRDPKSDCNVLPTKEEAEQHLAHMKLHQLRNFYRQGWKPNWRNKNEPKWCIEHYYGQYSVVLSENAILFLSFPSGAVAEKFLHNFRDLIAQAGDLV